MPIFQIIDVDVHDPELYGQYMEQSPEIIRRYGGHYIVRGGKVLSATGGWEPKRIVVISFESVENLRQCYASPEYQAIVHLRQQSSTSKSILVEGLDSKHAIT